MKYAIPRHRAIHLCNVIPVYIPLSCLNQDQTLLCQNFEAHCTHNLQLVWCRHGLSMATVHNLARLWLSQYFWYSVMTDQSSHPPPPTHFPYMYHMYGIWFIDLSLKRLQSDPDISAQSHRPTENPLWPKTDTIVQLATLTWICIKFLHAK